MFVSENAVKECNRGANCQEFTFTFDQYRLLALSISTSFVREQSGVARGQAGGLAVNGFHPVVGGDMFID